MKAFIIFLILLGFPPFLYAQPEASPENWVLEKIICSGNELTDCEYIKKEIYLSPGDKINEEEIQNAKFRLGVLGFFKKIEFKLQKGSKPGQVLLEVQVLEDSPLYTQSKLGVSSWPSYSSPLLGVKVGDRNLFGTGKILDLEADFRYDSYGYSGVYSRLQYTDPHLFGTQRNFIIAGLTYSSVLNNVFQELGYDFSLGHRIFDFSYISAEVMYQSFPTLTFLNYTNVLINYGWNSEDDAFLPTQGSKFIFSIQESLSQNYIGDSQFEFFLSFNKTWRLTDASYLTFILGGEPRQAQYNTVFSEDMGLALKYSHDVSHSENGDIQNGRWYVAPGIISYEPNINVGDFTSTTNYTYLTIFGAEAGIRLDSRSLGIVDLYVIGGQ